jgi:hypothetical protein
MIDLVLNVDGAAVCALVFDSNRAPFVVRNPAYGRTAGTVVSFEVPWREGTAVRSASRNDLLRVLTPAASLPDVELLRGELSEDSSYGMSDRKYFKLEVPIYVAPRSDGITVFPFHRCWCDVETAGAVRKAKRFRIRTERFRDPLEVSEMPSVMLEHSSSELVARGPGKCAIGFAKMEDVPSWATPDVELIVSIHLEVVGGVAPILLDARAVPSTSGFGTTWFFRPRNAAT